MLGRRTAPDGFSKPMNWLRGNIGRLPLAFPGDTPVPPPVPQPVQTPTPTPSPALTPGPTPQDHFLTDPGASQNRIVTGYMTLIKDPLESPPGSPPGRPWEGASGNRFLVLAKVVGLLAAVFRREANYDNAQSTEPNVRLSLHYSGYEDGVRVRGVRVRNDSEVPLTVYRIEVQERHILGDGTSYIRGQDFVPKNPTISPNSGDIVIFDNLDKTFPMDSQVYVIISARTVEHERQYRKIAYSIDVASGNAYLLPEGFDAGY